MGVILYLARAAGAPAFPTMFTCISLALLLTAAAFWMVTRDTGQRRPRVQRRAVSRPAKVQTSGRLSGKRSPAEPVAACTSGDQLPPADVSDAHER
jgi:hypothetical protein